MSDLFTYSEYEYIVPMDDDNAVVFINKTLLNSVEVRSKCSVELSKKILNKRIGTNFWTKFNIIKVKGPNERSIKMCNKLLEHLNLNYINRKEYDSFTMPTIYTTEFLPDNTNLIFDYQRLGANLDKYQGLNLCNRHRTTTRYPLALDKDNTPWKIYSSHVKGIHYPCQIKSKSVVAFLQQNIMSNVRPISHKIERSLPKLYEVIKRITPRSKIAKIHTNDSFDNSQKSDINYSMGVSNIDQVEDRNQKSTTDTDTYKAKEPYILTTNNDELESTIIKESTVIKESTILKDPNELNELNIKRSNKYKEGSTVQMTNIIHDSYVPCIKKSISNENINTPVISMTKKSNHESLIQKTSNMKNTSEVFAPMENILEKMNQSMQKENINSIAPKISLYSEETFKVSTSSIDEHDEKEFKSSYT